MVEHIKDDRQALINIRKLLRKNGRCIILVPAYQCLYNGFDEELNHYRRYTSETLTSALRDAGFRLFKEQYFNAMGIPGWYFSGTIGKNKTIPKGQISLYNAMVPAFRLIDKLLFNKVGLSVIGVGIKD